jgi:hypothetical protein
MTLMDRYGEWALVAGASEGLGEAWARGLAGAGLNVVLVARRKDPLEQVAGRIRGDFAAKARVEVLDLATPELASRLSALDDELSFGVSVYNAAYAPIGAFLDVALADKLTVVDVNVRGPLIWSDVLGRRMVARGRGALVVVSSIAGFQGSAIVGAYAASKAFDTVLGEGLWEELGHHGVDVMVCAAGSTLTPKFKEATPQDKRAGLSAMEPEDVVREALDKLGRMSGPTFIPGRMNRWSRQLIGRLLSRRAAVRLISNNIRGIYGERRA